LGESVKEGLSTGLDQNVIAVLDEQGGPSRQVDIKVVGARTLVWWQIFVLLDDVVTLGLSQLLANGL